eukprot:TRINITY_DN9834_c0_g1_i11.p1 TRINITY_DN9834_c0_g1~~TRINITY_DN9834_c0_g1_i11.p1  ORF type:complete len:171 (-),score=8.48 TRINITY_DN9834_c0_g1_i11:79-591(-)
MPHQLLKQHLNQAMRAAATKGHLPVVHALLQVPLVEATYHNNAALRTAVSWSHVELVEYLLRREDVAMLAGYPQAPSEAHTRRVLAISMCAKSDDDFGEVVAEAVGVAGVCVRQEGYPGMAEQICEYLWPLPVAWQAVHLHRHMLQLLLQLRRVRMPLISTKKPKSRTRI